MNYIEHFNNSSFVDKSGNKLIIIKTFKVLWEGWELDNLGYLIKDSSGKYSVVLTNHGRPFIADRKFVESKIREYRGILDETQGAFDLAFGDKKEGRTRK